MNGGILVVAPHPDDETLGAAGTLLAAAHRGTQVHCLIATAKTEALGFSRQSVVERDAEIANVAAAFGFASVHRLELPTTGLDTLPKADIVTAIAAVVDSVAPETVILPHGGDAHSDHGVLFGCGLAATKSFRHPSVRTVLTMEIVSETNFGIPGSFIPRFYVDISDFIDKKLEIMDCYRGEMGTHPFPRSRESLRALAMLRGSECGSLYAEAFDIVRMFGRP